MSKRVIVYTAIFGNKDELQEPQFSSADIDFVCFTDGSNLSSETWNIRQQIPTSPDPVRAAKIYKILPHRFFSGYEYSIWIDGNVIIRGDVAKLILNSLKEVNFAAFDHSQNVPDSTECIYDEAERLLAEIAHGQYPTLSIEKIEKQVERLKAKGYPAKNRMINGMVLLRRHNAKDCKNAMDAWWKEIVNGSRRDELSFNYMAWRDNFNFKYLQGDSRDNPYFQATRHKKS